MKSAICESTSVPRQPSAFDSFIIDPSAVDFRLSEHCQKSTARFANYYSGGFVSRRQLSPPHGKFSPLRGRASLPCPHIQPNSDRLGIALHMRQSFTIVRGGQL